MRLRNIFLIGAVSSVSIIIIVIIITLAASGVRQSVCPVGILTVTYQGAACDAASVHFGPK